MGEYPGIGNVATLRNWFKDHLGVLADPTTVSLEIESPSGAVSIVVPVRESVGVYSYDLLLTEPGTWYYVFVGTGDVVAASGREHLWVGDNAIPAPPP